MFKFFVRIFNVMGKALTGELSYPCDRSGLSEMTEVKTKIEITTEMTEISTNKQTHIQISADTMWYQSLR